MAGEGSKFRAAFSNSEATVRPKIARPSRICSGARPAKLNRNAPGSSRETAKYLPGMYATPARCAGPRGGGRKKKKKGREGRHQALAARLAHVRAVRLQPAPFGEFQQ